MTTRHSKASVPGIRVVTAILGVASAGVHAGVSSGQAHAAPAVAPITSVVVYADRAQVTRSRAVDCAKGEAVFEGLPSTLVTRSLSARLGHGGGEVVGIKYKEEATGPKERARKLQAELRQIDVALVKVDSDIDAARAIEGKLDSFEKHFDRTWQLQATQRKPPISAWDQALDLLREQALRASRRRIDAEGKRRELQRQRNVLRRELQQVRRARRRTTMRVTAMLKCSGRRTVNLSYVVPDATWRIAYQLRAKPAKGQVTVVAQAIVQQGTGEDWRDVRLAVSTANLQRKNTPPQIKPMRVSSRKPRSTRKVLARRYEHRRHLEAAPAAGPVSGKQKAQAAAGQPAAGVEQKLAMELTAAKRATVPADGRRIVVTLERKTLRGRFTLETVPKLYPYVYRKVSLHNPFSFTMLAGEASLFSGQSFLGRAQLKIRAPKEPFALSLGVENQLKVKRYIKREKLEGAGVFGSNKRLQHRYVITVGNWTPKRQKVRVLENIPVSQVSEIKVDLANDATKPSSWNKDDGILAWELSVPPRSKRKVVIGYTIAVPKSYIVTGYR